MLTLALDAMLVPMIHTILLQIFLTKLSKTITNTEKQQSMSVTWTILSLTVLHSHKKMLI